MRLLPGLLLASLLPVTGQASIVLIEDGRVIESICTIAANGETVSSFTAPDTPGNDWSTTFSICDVSFGGMTSAVTDQSLSAILWSEKGSSFEFDERVAVEFRLDFRVTEASFSEWRDDDGVRVEMLLPGMTYTILSFVEATSPSQGRIEKQALVRLIPEPTTLGLVALGVAVLSAIAGARTARSSR